MNKVLGVEPDQAGRSIWQVNNTYVDRGGWQPPDDQFLRWLHNGSATIANSGGIRWQSFQHLDLRDPDTKQRIPPYVVLVTTESSSQFHNPWSDIVSYGAGEIIYWGDSKSTVPPKPWNAFRGNRMIWGVNHLRLAAKRKLFPPFLHFTKPKVGVVRFSGLCMLRDVELSWHGEEGKPVRNLRLALDILDLEEVDPEWLISRSVATSLDVIDRRAPDVWRNAVSGNVQTLRLWRSGIRNKQEQMPIEGSDDAEILDQLRQLSGQDFERLVVSIVDLMPEIVPGLIHEVEQTRITADRGIDMFGFFRLPEPVSYVIPFKGEAKNWSSAVRPKDVSRLVSRLRRGEHGLFFTTSWYTEQAQEEVIHDQYPVRLFSGQDIVDLLRRANRAHGRAIDSNWLNAILRTSR